MSRSRSHDTREDEIDGKPPLERDLKAFYSVFRPAFLKDAERLQEICGRFGSDVARLNALLKEKYGVDLSSSAEERTETHLTLQLARFYALARPLSCTQERISRVLDKYGTENLEDLNQGLRAKYGFDLTTIRRGPDSSAEIFHPRWRQILHEPETSFFSPAFDPSAIFQKPREAIPLPVENAPMLDNISKARQLLPEDHERFVEKKALQRPDDAQQKTKKKAKEHPLYSFKGRGMVLPKEAEYLATTGPYSLVHRCMQTGSWARNLLADHCWQA